MALAMAVMAAAGVAQAETLSIFPTDFKNSQRETFSGSGSMVSQYPVQIFLKGYTENAFRGWVQLEVPVGRRLDRVIFFRRNTGTGNTSLYLNRVKVGKMPEQLAMISPAGTSWAITAHNLSWLGGADRVVRAGYLYYLDLLLTGDGICHGVKVVYE